MFFKEYTCCADLLIFFINVCYGFLVFFGRVNKPYLPIAAGDLSVKSAWVLVLLFAVAGLLIVGLNFGPFISSLYCLGLFLGTIYSVPPFRLKRFAVAAFLIVATVRCTFPSCLCFSFLPFFDKYDEILLINNLC